VKRTAPVVVARQGQPRARIGAVVLNYRTPELALGCVESLVADLDPSQDELVVVDNHSEDGSAERLREEIARRGWPARVIESPVNGGFAAGNNVGLRALDARAYLLMNSDARVLPGAVETLWRALERDPQVGLVGPRIESEEGAAQASCFRFPSPVSELLEGARTGPLDRLLQPWVVAIPADRAPRSPAWISFASILIRREALLQVGPLDEGFFLYFEDTEWCLRARRAGWTILHEPTARAVHAHGKSTGLPALVARRGRRPAYWYAARSRYFRASHGVLGLLAANAMRSLGHGVARLRETLGKKRPHAAERELLDLWAWSLRASA
jgi:N-acetylglucosaminyl-diphospho-decaprenol L-rhamnosyltransferase